MTDEVSHRRIKGILKDLGYDHLKAKEFKKKKRAEKAARHKGERHRSRRQEMDDLLTDALDTEVENGDER